jgi:S1-C subfamily serine protease
MSLPRTTLSIAALVLAAFVGGMVVSGRMSLSPDSEAAPEPTAQVAAPAPRQPPALPAAGSLPDLSTVAERALRVSANISSTIMREPPRDPFWQFFYGNQIEPSQSLGSGVIVSRDGYVLTNTHVIGNAGAEIRVTLEDGQERPGKLVGIDEVSDLAVVKVDAQNLPTLPWGDSSKLRVAEWVLAVGNPFQLSGTVTLGIVSTVQRSGDEIGSVQDFIQTDAAINPGNSGGALVNSRGELVGINTMIFSGSGGNQGIGFAIPSNTARQIMDELIRYGSVSWGHIGVVNWFLIDESVAARYGLTVTGAYVRSIARSASAYRAGLEPGDTVLSADGQKIQSVDQLTRLIIRKRPGSTIRFDVLKRNGRTVTIQVPVTTRDSQAQRRGVAG